MYLQTLKKKEVEAITIQTTRDLLDIDAMEAGDVRRQWHLCDREPNVLITLASLVPNWTKDGSFLDVAAIVRVVPIEVQKQRPQSHIALVAVQPDLCDRREVAVRRLVGFVGEFFSWHALVEDIQPPFDWKSAGNLGSKLAQFE